VDEEVKFRVMEFSRSVSTKENRLLLKLCTILTENSLHARKRKGSNAEQKYPFLKEF